MKLPVSTTAMNGDHLGTAENAEDALRMLTTWWDSVRGGSAHPETQITGVKISATRWNVPLDGKSWADRAYVPVCSYATD